MFVRQASWSGGRGPLNQYGFCLDLVSVLSKCVKVAKVPRRSVGGHIVARGAIDMLVLKDEVRLEGTTIPVV